MAGTLNGFLDHTMDSRRILNFYVNGRRTGELGVWAMVCAHFGVPMVMASGDRAAMNEAAQFFSGIETAEVKSGLSRMRARMLPDGEAEERIRQAAKRAVEKDDRPGVFAPILPMELKIDYMRGDYCDDAMAKPGLERIDVRAARKVSDTYLDYWL
jgi:D-amino peptidase